MPGIEVESWLINLLIVINKTKLNGFTGGMASVSRCYLAGIPAVAFFRSFQPLYTTTTSMLREDDTLHLEDSASKTV